MRAISLNRDSSCIRSHSNSVMPLSFARMRSARILRRNIKVSRLVLLLAWVNAGRGKVFGSSKPPSIVWTMVNMRCFEHGEQTARRLILAVW